MRKQFILTAIFDGYFQDCTSSDTEFKRGIRKEFRLKATSEDEIEPEIQETIKDLRRDHLLEGTVSGTDVPGDMYFTVYEVVPISTAIFHLPRVAVLPSPEKEESFTGLKKAG